MEIDNIVYGAKPDERGPIGGGNGYTNVVTKGDYTAETLDALLDALSKAKAGQTVFIPGEAEIDLTARIYIDQLVLEVPEGVTLAGDRGNDGSLGALLTSDALKTPVVICAAGPDVRITGLRLRGPNPKRHLDHHRRSFGQGGGGHEYYYRLPTSNGIKTKHPRLEVDNCEISGFSHAGVYLTTAKGHYVHHNCIHHCQYQGLGYGVCHNTASSLIEHNLFNWNRHSIAGTGRPGNSYVARHNVELGVSLSHCFDMHGGRDRKDGTDIAGTSIEIHHNTFRAEQTPVVIRGVPEEQCDVHHNWFLKHDTSERAVRASSRTNVYSNAFGSTPTAARRRGVIDTSKSPYAKLRSIPMQDTQLTDGFWSDRFELCADHMIPALKKAMLGRGSAKLNRIKFMAGLTNTNPGGTPWGDGDNYKWIETMAHAYNLNRDPALARQMDAWIEIIGQAQEPDGYISTNIGHDKAARFKQVNLHEMYNMGHLLTAACIHHRATGKETFLDIARKNADFLCRQWKAQPEQMARFPWNPSAYMGLAEMYRTTENPRYLELLQTMIDNRGSRPNPDRDHRFGGTDQTQDRVPIREETMAVGHAVTGTYFYCGVADLYAETGEKALFDALERMWSDICEKKTDITCAVAMFKGGSVISPRGDELHENFANEPYLQPNTYNETCANIGTGMFNYRMLLLTGDAKYADWTERMLYNTLNSGVDLEGEKWFYCNPLSWAGRPGEMRQSWHGGPGEMVPAHHTPVRWETNDCYCCPPSVARTTAKLHNWFYNISDDGALWVNFYGGNKLSTTLADGSSIALTQATDYPWDGHIEITIDQSSAQPLSIHFRIPGWVENPTASVNGKPYDGDVEADTYLEIRRAWSAGDTVVLNFPMPIRLIEANTKVAKLRNKVAAMRGPIVYCMELPKQDGGEDVYLDGVFLPENVELIPEHRADFLGGVTVLIGQALTFKGCTQFAKDNPGAETPLATDDGALYQPIQPRDFRVPAEGTVELVLIPYYAWANRGVAYMDVWMPLATQDQLVKHTQVVAEIEERIAAQE